MAISPNVNFSAGAVLTSAQQNRFPRGVMAFNTAVVTDSTITTTEEVQVIGSSFLPVANRYYKITYFEPGVSGGSGGNARIRLTNLAGAVQQLQTLPIVSTGGGFVHMVAVTNALTAVSTNFVATLQSDSATLTASRSATRYAVLLVEDIGPA